MRDHIPATHTPIHLNDKWNEQYLSLLPSHRASEVTTLWRYRNLCIIIIINVLGQYPYAKPLTTYIQKVYTGIYTHLSTSYMWAWGNSSSPLIHHFPISPPSTLSFSIFYFSLSYSLHLFSCFSIPSHPTRIVPLCFQAGCCRTWLNVDVVFLIYNYSTYTNLMPALASTIFVRSVSTAKPRCGRVSPVSQNRFQFYKWIPQIHWN